MNISIKRYSLSPVGSLDEKLLISCLGAGPLFLLTIAGWINAILFLALLLSVYILITDHFKGFRLIPGHVSLHWALWLVIALALPIGAVFLGQLFRHQFKWPNYDSPSRLLISIPILLAISHRRISVGQLFEYSIPTAVLLTFLIILLHPAILSNAWGPPPHRMTTRFVDPLTFGSLNFMFAMLCIVSADFKKDRWLSDAYKILGFAIGIYFSIRSGSRTGWFALPFILLLWLQFRSFKGTWGGVAFAVIITIVGSAAMYHYSSIVHEKINLALSDIQMYQWNKMNSDTSVGMRISFWRMAIFLFGQNPLGGWGDTGFSSLINAPEISRFASLYTREFALHAGFHNEIMTNMVRSGVWGLISSVAVFVIPAVFFTKLLFSKSISFRDRKLALLASCLLVCEFISGMSTEVLNLKFTAAFYALMVASLAGQLLKARQISVKKATL